jgi:hypothetical protein
MSNIRQKTFHRHFISVILYWILSSKALPLSAESRRLERFGVGLLMAGTQGEKAEEILNGFLPSKSLPLSAESRPLERFGDSTPAY